MSGRLSAWLRQAHNDLAMAACASQGGFHAQACYQCSQAAEKAIESLGIAAAPLRQLPLKPLQRMTTASRYPDGDEAPVDLFDERDAGLALQVAQAVVSFADQQLTHLPPPGSS
jgi:HEPN domain-containing protein